MSSAGAAGYVLLSVIVGAGWAALGYGGRKAWEWARATRHQERRR